MVEYMYNLVARFLDVLSPVWHSKLIGLSSDGAPVMTGEYNGVITQIEQSVPNDHKVYRTWCGLHQLDLVMQHGYKKLMDGKFLKITNKFIAHLRMQGRLITEMRCKCPALATRWVIMGKVCDWFIEHRQRLAQDLADVHIKEIENNVEAADSVVPLNWWWVAVAGVSAITQLVDTVFVKLQKKDML